MMSPKFRVVLYLAIGGLPATIAALGAGHFAWQWLAGMVLAASFVPVALFGPQSARGQFGVVLAVLFTVTVFCTWSGAGLFIPGVFLNPAGPLIGSAGMYLALAAALSAPPSPFKFSPPPSP